MTLTAVPNVTVEHLPDASLIGQLSAFQTNDPKFACLNGENLTVWSAPQEFPGVDVVHNGDQGPQCTYGTWTFSPSSNAASPNPISLSVTATPNPADTDQPVTVTATLSQPVNDGTVSITIAGTTMTCTPQAGTCTPNQQWANTSYGVYPITAHWSGDSSYGPASASAWIAVSGGATAPYTLTIDAGILHQPTLVARQYVNSSDHQSGGRQWPACAE